jgi:hypothetical protein
MSCRVGTPPISVAFSIDVSHSLLVLDLAFYRCIPLPFSVTYSRVLKSLSPQRLGDIS